MFLTFFLAIIFSLAVPVGLLWIPEFYYLATLACCSSTLIFNNVSVLLISVVGIMLSILYRSLVYGDLRL